MRLDSLMPALLLAVLLVAQLGVGGGVDPGGGVADTTTVPVTRPEDTTTTVETTTSTPVTTDPTTVPATTMPLPTMPLPTTPATTTPPGPSPTSPSPSTPQPTSRPVASASLELPDPAAPPPSAAGRQATGGAPVVRMDRPSAEPGGVVILSGDGCAPGAPVTVGVDGRVVGSIAGRDDGRFVAELTLPEFEPGRYDISIDCGAIFTVPVDVVVATSVESPNSVLALFVFFVLLALVLFRRRRIHRPDGTGGHADADSIFP